MTINNMNLTKNNCKSTIALQLSMTYKDFSEDQNSFKVKIEYLEKLKIKDSKLYALELERFQNSGIIPTIDPDYENLKKFRESTKEEDIKLRNYLETKRKRNKHYFFITPKR